MINDSIKNFQIGQLNMKVKPTEALTLATAKQVIKDVFISAAERDIQTGDGIHLQIITKDGLQEEYFDLRKD